MCVRLFHSKASLLAIIVFLFSMMFGGLFLNNNDKVAHKNPILCFNDDRVFGREIQMLTKILKRLSFIHFGYEGDGECLLCVAIHLVLLVAQALFVNEFDGLELDFNPDGFPVSPAQIDLFPVLSVC